MKIAKMILYIVLKILYSFTCLRPINRRQVTFITLTSAELRGDFKLLAEYIKERESDVKFVFILTRFEKNLKGDLNYFFNCIKQVFVINHSRVVIINDNNYVISNFKRKEVKVLQIWHACGAVKKFGNEVHRQYPIKNYDFVISSSEIWKNIYAKSFGVERNQVLPLGVARTDVLFDESWLKNAAEKMHEKYPVLKGRYVIFYAPTFRGNIIDGLKYEKTNLEMLLHDLPDDTVILYRMHPLLAHISLGECERIINVFKEELEEIYSVTDCLVTDYSSVVFDYSVLNKKIVLFAPDKEQYERNLGLNIALEDIPAEVCVTMQELTEALKNRKYSEDRIKKFRNKYAEHLDGKSTERIGEFILSLIKN